jgi:hypothetical protein
MDETRQDEDNHQSREEDMDETRQDEDNHQSRASSIERRPTSPTKRRRTNHTPSTTLSQQKPNFNKRLTLTVSEHKHVTISIRQCDLCYYIKHKKGRKEHRIIRASKKCVECDAVLCNHHYVDFHDSSICPSDY